MTMKRLLMVGMVVVMAGSMILVGCAPAAEEPGNGEAEVYEWRAAGVNSAEMFTTIVMDEAAERIEEQSNGRIKITHYAEGLLGDWDEVYEEVMRGVIEVGWSYIGGAYDINSQIHMLPYVSTDVNKLKKMVSPGGVLYDILSEVHGKDGVTYFGAEWEGWAGFSFTEVPDLARIMDPASDKRDIKMRVMPGDLKNEILFKEYGFSPAMTPWGELYLAFETGILDADGNNTITNMYAYFGDVLEAWIPARFMAIFGTSLYINTDLWNTLSEQDQKIFADNMQWAIDESVKREPAETARVEEQWAAEGVTILVPTQAQYDEITEFTQTEVWPLLMELFEDEYMNMIFEDLGLPTM